MRYQWRMHRADLDAVLSALVVVLLAATMIAFGCGKREVVSASAAAIALLMTLSLLGNAIRTRAFSGEVGTGSP